MLIAISKLRLICCVILILATAGAAHSDVVQKSPDTLDQATINAVLNHDRHALLSLLKQGANPNIKYSYQALEIDEPKNYTIPLLFKVLGWEHIGGGCLEGIIGASKRIIKCDPIMVKACIDSGADINAGREDGYSILGFAIRHSDPNIIRLLLDRHVDINTIPGRPFLVMAAENHRIEAAKMLLAHGVKIDERDYFGQTALIAASENYPAWTNNRQIQIDIVNLLLQFHANINLKNGIGSTALMYASSRHNVNLVQVLLAHHAEVNLKNNDQETALLCASSQFLDGDSDNKNHQIKIVKQLITAGADVNASDVNGSTALIHAAVNGNTQLAEFLIDHSADIQAKNIYGKTALEMAEIHQHPDIIKLLLKNDIYWHTGHQTVSQVTNS